MPGQAMATVKPSPRCKSTKEFTAPRASIGLRFVGIFRLPGAIHEGKGEAAVVIDKRAGLPIDQRHSLAIHNASGHERANFAVTHDAANSTVLHVTSVHLLSEPCMIY